jgi:type IV pilus assembly protein PilN
MLINLLPHRKWALARKRQKFATSLMMAALLGLVIAAVSSVWLGSQISAQLLTNNVLKKEIASVDGLLNIMAQVEADMVKLKLRETAFQAFQTQRKLPAVWLQEVVENLPDGLYLTALKQAGNDVNINGVARSNEEVFELLRRVARQGQWLAQVELIEVTDASSSLNTLALTGTPFAMRAQLKSSHDQTVHDAEKDLAGGH